MMCWHKGAVPAENDSSVFLHKAKKIMIPVLIMMQTASFTSHPHSICSIIHPRLRRNDDCMSNIQIWAHIQSVRHRKDAQRPEWQCHTRCRLASLTSITVPPLPHTQSHGVHFQMRPGLKPKHSYQNGNWLTAPSLIGWTILLEGLLKTEPPIDATRRWIILHPVATATPHNVSGNAVCCRASFCFRDGKILTLSFRKCALFTFSV